jgi:hypothetical protein
MAQLSNALCVDGIVLPMRADKPDVDDAVGIINPNHDTIFVSRDIEDSSAILENTGAANIALEVGRL